MENLFKLANVASKSEKLETLTEDEINLAYSLLDFRKIDPEVARKHIEAIDPEIIHKNIEFLLDESILPPLEEPDDVHEGGTKRAREPEQEPLPPRSRRPSQKLEFEQRWIEEQIEKQKAKDQARELAEQKLSEAEHERLVNLRSYDDLPEKLKSLPICSQNSASLVLRALFSPEVVEEWNRDCRAVYELSAIETQCEKVISIPDPDNNTCYICGFGFSEEEGLQRTCEHILPIIQAVFFLELYRTGDSITNAMKLEYAWAHRCCNAVKSDFSFLSTRINKNYPTYVFNKNQVSKILSKIMNVKGKFKGVEKIQEMIGTETEAWKNKRFDYIYENKMKHIVQYIAEKGDNGIAMMIGYRNCLENKNLHNDFKKLLAESDAKSSEKPAFVPKGRLILRTGTSTKPNVAEEDGAKPHGAARTQRRKRTKRRLGAKK